MDDQQQTDYDDVPEGYDYCLNCDGDGHVWSYGQFFPCPICDGTGIVPDDYEYETYVDLS